MNKLFRWFLILLFIPLLAFAGSDEVVSQVGLGGVASNLMQPVSVLSDFIQTACFVIGGAFLFASLIKYVEHRRSPLMVPISTVVFLFIAGVVLILLPIITIFMENGVPYSLMK